MVINLEDELEKNLKTRGVALKDRQYSADKSGFVREAIFFGKRVTYICRGEEESIQINGENSSFEIGIKDGKIKTDLNGIKNNLESLAIDYNFGLNLINTLSPKLIIFASIACYLNSLVPKPENN